MLKQKILLIGCGEHARMIIDNIEQNNKIKLMGLVTNKEDELGKKILGYEVVCLENNLEKYVLENTDIKFFFLGLGTNNMILREKVAKKVEKILDSINIIHPTAIISKYAKLGKGNLIEAYTKIANNVCFGSYCILNSFTSVNHDQIIEENVLLGCSVSMAGKKVGENSIISDGVSIGFKKSVGSNCIIGDGAVITKDIPDNSIAYGNPAVVVRKNDRR